MSDGFQQKEEKHPFCRFALQVRPDRSHGCLLWGQRRQVCRMPKERRVQVQQMWPQITPKMLPEVSLEIDERLFLLALDLLCALRGSLRRFYISFRVILVDPSQRFLHMYFMILVQTRNFWKYFLKALFWKCVYLSSKYIFMFVSSTTDLYFLVSNEEWIFLILNAKLVLKEVGRTIQNFATESARCAICETFKTKAFPKNGTNILREFS